MIKNDNTTEVNTLSIIQMSGSLCQVQGALANMPDAEWEYEVLAEVIEFLDNVIVKPNKEMVEDAETLKELFTSLREGGTTDEDAVKRK